MFIINNEVDLGKSFEKLTESLKKAYETFKTGKPGCHARALGNLESAVKIHLIECSHMDMKDIQDYIEQPDNDPDDLKNINI